MKPLRSTLLRISTALFGLGCLACSVGALGADVTAISAKDLAQRLSDLQAGTSYVRLRLEVKPPGDATKIALQIQIKERRTKTNSDVVYQILWPKERKGESILLRQADGAPPTGSLFMPPDKRSTLSASQMNGTLFGSDLSYEDIIENFFAWENQTLLPSEVLNRVNCLVLESKPGKSELSAYAVVRSWIDPRRLIPLRVEKYFPAGKLARRIDTTRVVTDDKGRSIPANLTVRGPREDSVTDLDGSRIKHDVVYADREFTPEGLGEISASPLAPE